MHNDLLEPGRPRGAMNGRGFGKIGPSTDEVEQLHRFGGEGVGFAVGQAATRVRAKHRDDPAATGRGAIVVGY